MIVARILEDSENGMVEKDEEDEDRKKREIRRRNIKFCQDLKGYLYFDQARQSTAQRESWTGCG